MSGFKFQVLEGELAAVWATGRGQVGSWGNEFMDSHCLQTRMQAAFRYDYSYNYVQQLHVLAGLLRRG